jgi:hypothetical protein
MEARNQGLRVLSDHVGLGFIHGLVEKKDFILGFSAVDNLGLELGADSRFPFWVADFIRLKRPYRYNLPYVATDQSCVVCQVEYYLRGTLSSWRILRV